MAAPINLSSLVGKRPNFVKSLIDFQNDVIKEVLSHNPAANLAHIGHIPLEMLPVDRQILRMQSYREITGLNLVLTHLAGTTGTMEQQIGRIASSLNMVRGMETEAPFGRLPIADASAHASVLRGMSLNYDPNIRQRRSGLLNPNINESASAHFGPGLRIPLVSEERFNMPHRMKTGARYTVFDLETASLMPGQIREVSYATGIAGRRGPGVAMAEEPILFRPRMFSRGSVGFEDKPGKIISLSPEDFLKRKHGFSYADVPTENLGADFANRMTPFLNNLLESDHIIGHNILSFDIPQLFRGLAGTKEYAKNEEFRNLVDRAGVHTRKNAIDTLIMARDNPNLAGLAIDPSILAKGGGTTYSIENLLLQTDLSDRIGHEKLKALMGDKGLHFGSVDDKVTMAIYEHMDSLQPKALSHLGLAGSIRKQIEESAALTLTTNARVHTEVSDAALKRLIRIKNGIVAPDGSLASHAELNELMRKAQSGDRLSAKYAFDRIRSGKIEGLRFNVNPIEHQALTTRRLGKMPNIPVHLTDSLVYNNNLFDRTVNQGIGVRRDHTLGMLGQRPITDKEMFKLQNKLKARGVPFAGLSYEERTFGTSLSHLTSRVLPTPSSKTLSELGSDLMISRFEAFNPLDVEYRTASGRVSVPIGLLTEARANSTVAGEAGEALFPLHGRLMGLSHVRPTLKDTNSRINLVHRFQGDENERLASYIEELGTHPDDRYVASRLGVPVDIKNEADPTISAAAAKFREESGELARQIREHGEYGISIGQLQPEVAGGVRTLLENTYGTDNLADRNISMSVPFYDSNSEVVRTAGAIVDTHVHGSEALQIGEHVAKTAEVEAGYLGLTGHQLRIARSDAAVSSLAPIVKDVYEAYQKFREHSGKILGAAAIVGIGAHIVRKREENKRYQETMDQQEFETGNNQYGAHYNLQQSIASGVNAGYQKYDPLKTAYVVGNLNDNKIGHTIMSNTRNNLLFGGVL